MQALARCSVAALLTGLAAAPASAQAAAQEMTCGWHFIEPVAEPPVLATLAARATATTPELQDAVARLQRWYSECDATAARVAAQSLRRLAARRNAPDRSLAEALHGLALVRGPEVHVTRGSGVFAKPARFLSNSERDGVRLLVRSFNATSWPELAEELAETAFATRKPETLRAAADALRSAAKETGDAGVYALLAEVELLRQQYAAAVADGRRAADGGDARGARARGMALMLTGEEVAGADAYLAGLDGARGPLLHRYYDDIRGLLGEDELDEWDRLEPAARAAWIRQKWEWRALLAGVTVNARLAEHHRRLEHVMKAFSRQSYRGAAPLTSIWSSVSRADMPLDDRGIVYLRHGPPDREIRMMRTPAYQALPPQRIAWGYGGLGGDGRVFEFDRASDVPDYFLAGPVPVCQGVEVPGLLRPSAGMPVVGDLRDWAGALHAFDPSLAMYYQACEQSPVEDLPMRFVQARADAVQDAHDAWRTETALPRHEEPLATSLNLYAFRAGAATELVGYISLTAGRLAAAASAAGSEYALHVMFGAGAPDGPVARVDTTVQFTAPQPLPRDARVGFAVPLQTRGSAAARVTATVSNRHDSRQGRVMSAARPVPSFAGGLASSDIVLAEDRDGTWRRGTQRLAPLPGHVVPANALFRVYHEVYGAGAGDPLIITLTIAPGTDPSVLGALRSLVARRAALSLIFREQADTRDGVTALPRTVTANLEPGSYVLMITVVNERTGETAEARTPLVVVR